MADWKRIQPMVSLLSRYMNGHFEQEHQFIWFPVLKQLNQRTKPAESPVFQFIQSLKHSFEHYFLAENLGRKEKYRDMGGLNSP